jgi:hypothetical protein
MVSGISLALSFAAQAQRPERVATRIDSLRAARYGQPTYFAAQFTLTSGKQVRGYVDNYTTCLLDQVQCYEVPPDRLPKPKLKVIGIERLQRMTVDGHTLEALYIKGKPMKILAENMAAPGPMQIFGYAKTKNDMLIPIPLPIGGAAFISTGTHEKYYWYVRPVGGELREVPRGQKEFVEFMSKLCAQAPALVAERHPARGTEGARKPRYQVDNAPELLSQYNAAVAGQ